MPQKQNDKLENGPCAEAFSRIKECGKAQGIDQRNHKVQYTHDQMTHSNAFFVLDLPYMRTSLKTAKVRSLSWRN
jgi:hypothetical protein